MKNKFILGLGCLALLACGASGCGKDEGPKFDFEVTDATISYAKDVFRKHFFEETSNGYEFEVEQHVFVCCDFKIEKLCNVEDIDIVFTLTIPFIDFYSCKDYVAGNADKESDRTPVDIIGEDGNSQKGLEIKFKFPLLDKEIHAFRYTFEIAGNQSYDNLSLYYEFEVSHNANHDKISINGSDEGKVSGNYSFINRGN